MLVLATQLAGHFATSSPENSALFCDSRALMLPIGQKLSFTISEGFLMRCLFFCGGAQLRRRLRTQFVTTTETQSIETIILALSLACFRGKGGEAFHVNSFGRRESFRMSFCKQLAGSESRFKRALVLETCLTTRQPAFAKKIGSRV